ncbi:MAG TPA: GAP family protein [Mycobacteriales bacterium]
MIVEILVLALASTVRPTSLAAVSALLSHTARRRLLLAYLIGGLAFTVAFGVIVVGAFHGIHFQAGSSRTKGIADLVGGVVVLLFGIAVATRVVRLGPDRDAPRADSPWKARLERRLTVPTAVIAGPLTHLPGLFYLIALNVIVAHDPRVPGGLVAVLIYDAIWFAVPIAALAVCIVSPDAARAAVGRVQAWTGLHARVLLLVTSFAVGAALVIRGALSLAGVSAG